MKRSIETVFSWLVFPVTMVATLCGARVLLERGVEPAGAIAPFVLGTFAFLTLAERVFPYERKWLHSRGDLKVDIAYFMTNAVAVRVGELLAMAGAMYIALWISQHFGGLLWPAHWPWVAQLSLGLVLGEFVEYWLHRLEHETKFLWRIHATHHSAPRLYWLNAIRFHPIDIVLGGVGRLVPVAALGAAPEMIALLTLFGAVHGAFQHANLQIRLGPLNWVFSMAELHRWHHSIRATPSTCQAVGFK